MDLCNECCEERGTIISWRPFGDNEMAYENVGWWDNGPSHRAGRYLTHEDVESTYEWIGEDEVEGDGEPSNRGEPDEYELMAIAAEAELAARNIASQSDKNDDCDDELDEDDEDSDGEHLPKMQAVRQDRPPMEADNNHRYKQCQRELRPLPRSWSDRIFYALAAIDADRAWEFARGSYSDEKPRKARRDKKVPYNRGARLDQGERFEVFCGINDVADYLECDMVEEARYEWLADNDLRAELERPVDEPSLSQLEKKYSYAGEVHDCYDDYDDDYDGFDEDYNQFYGVDECGDCLRDDSCEFEFCDDYIDEELRLDRRRPDWRSDPSLRQQVTQDRWERAEAGAERFYRGPQNLRHKRGVTRLEPLPWRKGQQPFEPFNWPERLSA